MTDVTSVGATQSATGDAPGAPIPAGVLADAGAAIAVFLRLDPSGGAGDDEAALVRRLAAVGIALAEAFLGQALILRAFQDVVAADGGWRALAAEPVRGIAGVTGAAEAPAGAAPFVLPVDDYRIDIGADGRGWVRVTPPSSPWGGGAPLAAVAYSAGLATDWASLPPPIAQGVVTLAAALFLRDAGTALPAEVAALWRPFRRLRCGGNRR